MNRLWNRLQRRNVAPRRFPTVSPSKAVSSTRTVAQTVHRLELFARGDGAEDLVKQLVGGADLAEQLGR